MPEIGASATHPSSSDASDQTSVFHRLGFAVVSPYSETQQSPLRPNTPGEKKTGAAVRRGTAPGAVAGAPHRRPSRLPWNQTGAAIGALDPRWVFFLPFAFEDPAMRLTDTRTPILALAQVCPGRLPGWARSRSATNPPHPWPVAWRSSPSCPPGCWH